MDAAAVCFALGQQACHRPSSVWKDCEQLRSCGIFRRTRFLQGCQSCSQQLQPMQLISLVTTLVVKQLFGWEFLQALLPDPAQACSYIHKACCVRPCTQHFIDMQPFWLNRKDTKLAEHKVHPAMQLVQLLLEHILQDDALTDSNKHSGQDRTEGAALQQYVLLVVQHLQEAAAMHGVLAVCLFQAAALCVPSAGIEAVGRWMLQQLRRLLHWPSTTPAQPLPAQQQAAAIAAESWESAALEDRRWCYVMLCMLTCVTDEQVLLQLLQESISSAVMTAQGLDMLCAALEALRGCSATWSEAMHNVLVGALSSALHDGHLRRLLPPLLLSQQLLNPSEYQQLLMAAAEACCALDNPSAASAWSCLLDAFTLALPAANVAVLNAHLQLLQQYLPSATGITRSKISSTLDTVKDVVQSLKQQQQQADMKKPTQKLDAAQQRWLDQFREQPVGAGNRRRLGEKQTLIWKVYKGHVQAFCEAISLNNPGSVEEARVRWEYLLALQDIGVLPVGQLDKFWQALSMYGITMQDVIHAGTAAGRQAAKSALSPMQVLQQLLNELPAAVADQKPGYATAKLSRLEEQLQQILQQQQQQQEQLPGASHAQGGPAIKRQRTAEGNHTSSTVAAVPAAATDVSNDGSLLHSHLVRLFLEALGAAMENKGKGIEWRVGFVQLLQRATLLHGALLQQMLQSMTGCPADQSPRRVAAQGRLLALMGCCVPSQLLLLQPGTDALVVQQDCATPAYTWRPDSAVASGAAGNNCIAGGAPLAAATAAAAGAPPAPGISGVQLVRRLLCCVRLDNPQQCCCAVSFWAGYMAEVKYIGCWCAGIHGPFQKERPSSAGFGVSGSPPAAAGRPELLAYVPVQIVALLNTLQQQLSTALHDKELQQQDLMLIQGCYEVCSNTLGNSKPLRWARQKCHVKGLQGST